ncbi:MAG: precorrin-6Y C5,15-methyltransferase (decarboxylating) subunit CbiT [Chloroflexi bacterium]|nr:precorrin-6Y C5,15-methyltransferase (decarboxylating) subunit CbiT [Chloroflexota bacterium]
MPVRSARSPWTLGIPDSEFFQRRPLKGLITKMEVRVITLAKMGVREDSVVWDIGAGSGAVSVEAARLAVKGKVYSVEKDPASIQNINRNMEKFGVANMEVVPTFAPDGLDALPDPDVVFIGGSGGRLKAILESACARLRADGRLVMNAASLDTLTIAKEVLDRLGWHKEITIVGIARTRELKDILRFESLNPVFVICAHRAEPASRPRTKAAKHGR